jgi:hypothetical protein
MVMLEDQSGWATYCANGGKRRTRYQTSWTVALLDFAAVVATIASTAARVVPTTYENSAPAMAHVEGRV